MFSFSRGAVYRGTWHPGRGNRLSIWVSLGVAVLSAAAWAGEGEGKPRTWTDDTGTRRVEATLVRVEGEFVYLKRADSRVVKVAIERLSEADRTFLKSQPDPFDPPANESPPVHQAAVSVWCRSGNATLAASGIVLDRDAKLAYVAAHVPRIVRELLAAGTVEYTVDVYANGKPRRVPATRVGLSIKQNVLYLTIPADAVSVAARPGTDEPAEDQSVQVIGFEITTSDGTPVTARVSARGKVGRIFRDATGSVQRFDVAAPEATPVIFGLVVADNGQVIGVTGGSLRGPMPEGAGLGVRAEAARFLDTVRNWTLEDVAAVPLSPPGECEFVVYVSDPFRRLREPKLHLPPAGAARTAPPAAFGTTLQLQNAEVLPLKAGKPSDEALPWLAASTPVQSIAKRQAEWSTWIVRHKAAIGGSWYAQLEGRDEQRATYSPVVAISVLQTTNDGNLPPTGFPLGPAVRTPHPKGGVLVTGEATRLKPEMSRDTQWKADKSPQPEAAREPLAGPEFQLAGTPTIALQVDVKTLLADAEWSQDGKRLILLHRNGLLRQLEVPSFVQAKRLDLQAECSSLARCRAGLVVMLSATQRVLLIDEESLAVKASVIVPGGREVRASPKADTAYVLGQRTLDVIDWSQRATAHRLTLTDAPRFMAATPDGRYLFLANNNITRYRVEGLDLVQEEIGPQIGSNPGGLSVSPDSKWVCLPSGGGNQPQPGFPSINYGTYVFAVDKLSAAASGHSTGAYPRTFGFDPVSDQFYAQNHDSLLLVLSSGGAQIKKLAAPGVGETERFHVHPSGGRLLIKTNGSLLWLRLTDQEDAPVEPAAQPAATPRAPANDPHREWLANKAPKPIEASQSLVKNERTLNEARVVTLNLPSEGLAGQPVWSADGQFFLAVTKKGEVRRIRLSDFQEVQRLELGAACADCGLAKSGLAVAVADWQAVVGVDPKTLQITSRTDVAQPGQIAAAPAHDLVFVKQGPGEAPVSIVDLAQQSILQQFTAQSWLEEMRRLTPGVTFPLVDFSTIALTPDGRYLIARNILGFSRFRLRDTQLLFEETAPVRCDNPSRICISSDSRLVALPSGGGNRLLSPKVERGTTPYQTCVFEVGKLSTPLTIVSSGAYPRAIAFDPRTKQIYAQNSDSPLLVFNDKGDKLSTWKLGDRGHDHDPVYFAPHPEGGCLLVLARTESWWVELPKAETP